MLILKVDIRSYTWLWPSSDPHAETATTALARWISSFGSMSRLVSDQGSHFNSQLVAQLADETRKKQHFTTVYCPWANGIVESLCKEVLRTFKTLLSERRRTSSKWPGILQSIKSTLNQSALELMGKRHCIRIMEHANEYLYGRWCYGLLVRPQSIAQLSQHALISAARAREVAILSRSRLHLKIWIAKWQKKTFVEARAHRKDTRADKNDARRLFDRWFRHVVFDYRTMT